jgi:coatomer subunit beta'
MGRGHYPSADEYLNYAEKSDSTLVEAFKRMQVIEDEEEVDALDESGEPDEEVLHLHHASYPWLTCIICYGAYNPSIHIKCG